MCIGYMPIPNYFIQETWILVFSGDPGTNPCGYQETTVCHILFIHAYVDAQLGHFHPLATVDNAVVNNGVQAFTESLLSIFLGIQH